MSTFEFINSPFKQSPFGEFWEQEHTANNVIEKDDPVIITQGYESVSFVLRNQPYLLDRIHQDTDTTETNVRTFVLFSGSIISSKGKIGGDDDLSEIGLSYEQIDDVPYIQAGKAVRAAAQNGQMEILQSKILPEITKSLMVPTADPKGLKKKIEKLLANALAKQDPLLSLPSSNVLMMILQQLRKELGDALPGMLNYIADRIDRWKITDPDRWMPIKQNGDANPRFNPLIGFDPSTASMAIDKLMESLAEKSQKYLSQSYNSIQKLWAHLYMAVGGALTPILQGMKYLIEGTAAYLNIFNAFVVGLYNGAISFISDLFRLVAFAMKAFADEEFRDGVMEQISTAVDDFMKKGLFDSITGLLKSTFDRYAEAGNIYNLAKILGEDTIAIIETLLMVMAGGAAVAAAAKGALKIVKGLAKKAKKGLDNFLKSFDVDKAVKEAMEDFGKQADDVAESAHNQRLKKLTEKYGKAIRKGDPNLKNSYDNELAKIMEQTKKPQFIDDAKIRYKKKKRKLSLDEYIKRHQVRVSNILKGAKSEEVFLNFFKGIKPSKAIKTSHTNRFIDNVLDGTAREVKSGTVKNTKAFQKQFMKDVDIVRRKLREINSYEWHVLNGIDDEAIKWAIDHAKKQGVELKIKFIIY